MDMVDKKESPVVKAAKEYVAKNGGDIKSFIAGSRWKAMRDFTNKLKKL